MLSYGLVDGTLHFIIFSTEHEGTVFAVTNIECLLLAITFGFDGNYDDTNEVLQFLTDNVGTSIVDNSLYFKEMKE